MNPAEARAVPDEPYLALLASGRPFAVAAFNGSYWYDDVAVFDGRGDTAALVGVSTAERWMGLLEQHVGAARLAGPVTDENGDAAPTLSGATEHAARRLAERRAVAAAEVAALDEKLADVRR